MEELAKLSQLLFKTNYFSVVWLYARMCSAGAMNLICFCLTSKPYLFGPWLAGEMVGWWYLADILTNAIIIVVNNSSSSFSSRHQLCMEKNSRGKKTKRREERARSVSLAFYV